MTVTICDGTIYDGLAVEATPVPEGLMAVVRTMSSIEFPYLLLPGEWRDAPLPQPQPKVVRLHGDTVGYKRLVSDPDPYRSKTFDARDLEW